MSSPAIELVSLGKTYGSKHALAHADLTVGRGEIFGYVGPNGAGKTTTMRILAGLTRPTSGDARVLGFSVVREPIEVKSRIGFVPESGAVFDRFAPAEYVRLVGGLHGIAPEDAAERGRKWLDAFGLGADRDKPMMGLSKGTRQKVCWITALLHEPEVLVLDEPLNALDVESVALVKQVLTEHAARGGTVFYSSHLLEIVAKICTSIAILHAGSIVATGSVADVIERYEAASLEELLLRLGRGAA